MSCLLSACASRLGIKSPSIEASDAFKMKQAVYTYFFDGHLWNDRTYSAVFLSGSDAEVRAFMRKFPTQIPPIKPSSLSRVQPFSTPIDKETGKPAIILSVTTADPEGARAEAIGTCYAGALLTTRYLFRLERVGDGWAIDNVKALSQGVD